MEIPITKIITFIAEYYQPLTQNPAMVYNKKKYFKNIAIEGLF